MGSRLSVRVLYLCVLVDGGGVVILCLELGVRRGSIAGHASTSGAMEFDKGKLIPNILLLSRYAFENTVITKLYDHTIN